MVHLRITGVPNFVHCKEFQNPENNILETGTGSILR
jgi:hypothetical protein